MSYAERLQQPELLARPNNNRLEQTALMDVVDAARKVSLVTDVYLPTFAQTPDYIHQIWKTHREIKSGEGEFVRDRLTFAARSFASGPDRVVLLREDVLKRPALPPHLWRWQLETLLRNMRHAREDFGVLPGKAGDQPATTWLIDDEISVEDTHETWCWMTDTQPAKRRLNRLMKQAVWERDAEDLVKAALREYELTIDVREPQRYF